jgi:hypothetical protein
LKEWIQEKIVKYSRLIETVTITDDTDYPWRRGRAVETETI